MFTNFIRAKISTHTLIGVIAARDVAANPFFSDPRAATWLRNHWAPKDLAGTAGRRSRCSGYTVRLPNR
jgi:hypothetical protein